jgi:hypothetical protein
MFIYNQISIRKTLLGVLTLILLLLPSRVSAETYTVTASVPFDVPTIAATVTSPISDYTTDTNTVIVQGSCEVLVPVSIVSVWNGAVLVGSTTCIASGNYSLSISLNSGINTLVVRTSNISSVYGPDSSVFNITYNKPQESPISQPNNNSVPIAQEQSELKLTSSTTFGVLNRENEATISINIEGGFKPYKIEINWGDGSTLSQTIDEPGVYSFTHKYDKSGNYPVVANVYDALGNRKTFGWAIVSEKYTDQPVIPPIPSNTDTTQPPTMLNFNLVTLVIILLGSIFIFISGEYFEANKKRRKPRKQELKLKSR